jgi:hypothetical protein
MQRPIVPPTETGRHRGVWRRAGLAAVAVALAASALVVTAPGPAQAAPYSGSTPWMVLLCTPSDAAGATVAPDTYRQMFTTRGDAGHPTLYDYWDQVSNHVINLTYSDVSSRWFTTDKTLAQLRTENRAEKLQDCIRAAGPEVSNPGSFFGIMAIWNVSFNTFRSPGDTKEYGDSGETGGGPVPRTLNGTTKPYAGVVIEPWAAYLSYLAHEMGHGYGLDHSFGSGNCVPGLTGPVAAEYCDPYDVMGQSDQGLNGPGMNAFNLDKLGFIPAGRRADITVGTGQRRTVTLTALSAPNPTGFLTANVYNGSDTYRYYTIEYRRSLNLDRGINVGAAGGVLIHLVSHDFVPDHQLPLSYLRTPSADWRNGAWTVGETYGGADYFHITVQAIDPVANTATVLVSGPSGVVHGPPPPPPGDNGQGAGGCGATGCGQHPPGWKPGPIQFQ